jgi:hypothetical protein
MIIKPHDAIVRQRGGNMLNDEELKARILQNLQRTTQQRLMKVMYNVTIYLKDGSTLSRVFRIREADLLYGTK